MRVRICIAIDDDVQRAYAAGWDIDQGAERKDDWSMMDNADRGNNESEGFETSRHLWAEIEIPDPTPLLEPTVTRVDKVERHPYGPPDELGRVAMTPWDFNEAVAMMVQCAQSNLVLTPTSTIRGWQANMEAKGDRKSKHCVDPCMALDYRVDNGDADDIEDLVNVARSEGVGLWAIYHDTGSGPHLHIQGLPPGPIHPQWLEDWASDETKAWAKEVYS